MEACASSHYWGREIGKLGHEVKLVPPIYVKPFVKRQKTDATDAEAICEAASRPTMGFVAVETREQQAQGMLSRTRDLFRTRDLLVRERTPAPPIQMTLRELPLAAGLALRFSELLLRRSDVAALPSAAASGRACRPSGGG